MKYLPTFNKGDKVTINNKYIGLKSMVGEIYTIRAGPARCSDTWCYWLENVAGGIAADALEPLEQTNEEWLRSCTTEQLAEFLHDVQFSFNTCTLTSFRWYKSHSKQCPLCMSCAKENGVIEWLKQPHKDGES